MYLKSIEIRGFKSFGDLVEIKVPEGITAVIGPNGCGKSNIADAMRWVLGEQSAKLLRGDRMQDVIFSGTQNRKGLGYAQVSMTIDNSKGDINIDYSEIVITRRVYRSGESEYLLNKSPCRLKDIHELFMNTGVGKEGYSIIGQGQIDQILSSRPEERRNLFDEAAGIYKYKVRKIEAEKKLEKEKDNLLRVQDIITEIESRLETLETQAQMAKKYLSISDNLKIVDLNIFLEESQRLNMELEKLNNINKKIKEDYNSNNISLEKRKLEYENLRKKLNELDDEISKIQSNITNIMMTTEKKEGNIKLYLERLETTKESIIRLEQENKKRLDKNKNYKQEVNRYLLKEKQIQEDIEKQESKLEELNLKQDDINTKLKNKEALLDNSTQEKYSLISKNAAIDSNMGQRDLIFKQIKDKENELEEIINISKQDEKEKTARLTVLENSMESLNNKINVVKNNILTLNDKLNTTKVAIKDIYSQKRQLEDIYHKSVSKYKALLQMKNDYEGFFSSVKNILNLKKKDKTRWEGIYGVVGEVIEVPKDLEVAIDVALGNSIQHIITRDEDAAKSVVEYIKKYKLGRATFLPLTSIKSYKIGQDINNIVKEHGVIGVASDLIKCNKLYINIVENLLGRVIIVDNMQNAISLSRKYKYRYRVVTLDGEILNPGGSITGGNFHKSRSNVFSRTRAIEELEEQIKDYKKQLSNIDIQASELENSIVDIEKEIENNKIQESELEKNQMKLFIELENSKEQLEQIKIRLKNSKKQKELIKDEFNSTNKNMDDYEKIFKENKSRISELENLENQLKESIESIKKEKDNILNNITEIKISLSSKYESINSINIQLNRIKEDLENSFQEETSYFDIIAQNNNYIEELNNDIKQLKKEIEKNKQKLEIENKTLLKLKEQKSALLEEEALIRKDEESMNEKGALLKEELYRVENKITKLNLNKENIYNKTWNEYEMTYEMALEYKKDLGSIKELKNLQEEYKSQIRSLGVINTAAIEEYTETKERFDFLKEQEQDIIKAEETLNKLIDDLTNSMEEIFVEEFEKISENFNIVFTELFGGGKAFLQLTQADNALESGIEIIAQPPGKKLQNMMLLSGGERALTAIAILFGILRLKPSPFAVLDEIEAALDEANVVRFANYLKEMGNTMQFIVITHRKGTMTVADTIYGVTMEEQGVSKVLSIQLDETNKYIS